MIDEKDHQIIKELQINSRVSLTSLSEKFKMTRNAIKYRINRLEEEGYIGKYTTIINPAKFGKRVTAIFNFNIPLDQITKVAKELKKYDSISNIYFTTGHYSIYAFGVFENHEELNKFLIDKLSHLPIREYVISTVLERFKEQYFELK
jgi:Lrp/AsnC family transcriptional regulator for asnA, asnC and gidA